MKLNRSDSSFRGIWGTLCSEEETIRLIEFISKMGIQKISVHSPYHSQRIEKLMAKEKSYFGVFALIGSIAGVLLSSYFIFSTAYSWVIPLANKKIFAVIPSIPIIFESTILFALAFSGIGLLISVLKRLNSKQLPTSKNYLEYGRFTKDRFAIVVACSLEVIEKINELFKSSEVEEIFIES